MTEDIVTAAPLHGVRVLDLTRLLPAPVGSLYLGDQGADIIWIEDTGAGDYKPAQVRVIINRNGRSLRLDLKQGDGKRAFLALLATADVLVERFRPSALSG